MIVGDKVRATGNLGGWAQESCTGRPVDSVVFPGTIGTVLREAEWMAETDEHLGERGVWFVVRFDCEPDADMFVPCTDDHVEVV